MANDIFFPGRSLPGRRGLDRQAGPALSRRGFLVTMCAAGAVFGFPRELLAAINPAVPGGAPLEAVGARYEPSIWYWIDGKGQVNVNIAHTEMGQHIGTALARVLADELGADWANVQIEHVDSDPKWGLMITGGSTSVPGGWPVYRQAGAAGRVALTEKAAALWGIDAAGISIEGGILRAGDKSISMGELVQQGLSRSFTEDELKALPLKPNSAFTLIGRDVTALDIPLKTTGQALYGIDAKVAGMVHAVPILPPTRYDSVITAIDDTAAKAVRGYQQVLKLDDPSGNVPGWAMVIADSHWAAQKAAREIKVTYNAAPSAKVTEADLIAEMRKAIADPAQGTLLDTGPHDVDPAFSAAAETIEAEYTTATVLHFQLEPLNALAFQNASGIWEIHCGNQFQTQAVIWLQKALGVGDGKVVIHPYLVGGGFGRRLNSDYTVPVALASKALGGKPVKMVMPREEDVHFDSVRSPTVQKLRMAFDSAKSVTAMDTAIAAGWPSAVLVPGGGLNKGLEGGEYDGSATDGADHWYEVGQQRLRAIKDELAEKTLRVGWLRSVGPGFTIWAVESFLDEAAKKIGKDPVAFRLEQLKAEGRNAGTAPMSVGGAARQAHVLSRVAEISGYGKAALPADTAIGIATSFGQSRDLPTWVGGAVQAHVDRQSGQVQVQKIWLVVDCGTVIDPDGAHAQIEGGALWGLSMAMFEGTEIESGAPRDRNLDSYTPLRMVDTPPEIVVELVESTEAPVGLGEPGVTLIAPALANAIASAVGVRLRHLPITPEAVKAALSA
ncbi:xanthine dehydrogenase family protein molybdopterin-binding subunit [Paracoccus aminophilus]|uniref:Isoquinoline 1-oxidoreductase, beta subunit n=1 Tax=Paracoccus aminophilus JCM 7686 TaxID=1367847 RepID=S5XT37_PARAH|nr:molybdopterin cofactor-binding domain-containing protein [Paracoccus aminophilus]AGT08317.1 isoquinoline 1-oxidoreductase, beta subunit [Paracoccus aminophilus JCM 7686]